MAEASMLLLTVLAAGAAAVSTGVVVARSNGPSPASLGNTVTVLCLSSAESADAFTAVVESELSDTARAADAPGCRLVFRTVDATAGPEVKARRFASVAAEAIQSDQRHFAGALVDAAGLAALVQHHKAGGADTGLKFVVAVSPAAAAAEATPELLGKLRHWGCAKAAATGDAGDKATADKKAAVADSPLVRLDECQAALQKLPVTVVLQGMESPFAQIAPHDAGPPGRVVASGVPGRGFLVYDESRLCPGDAQSGGADSMFTADQLKEARKARLLSEPAPAEEPLFKPPAFLQRFAGAHSTRGQNLCGGLLKRAVDTCLEIMPVNEPHEALRRINQAEDYARAVGAKVVGDMRAAARPTAGT